MKEEPATAGEARAAFNYLCLLRASCYRLFAGCQEHTVTKYKVLSTGKREDRILL